MNNRTFETILREDGIISDCSGLVKKIKEPLPNFHPTRARRRRDKTLYNLAVPSLHFL